MFSALSGMDGWEASRRILAVYRPCIIMLIGQPEEMIRMQMTAVGVCSASPSRMLGTC